jgi:hypothetical protein
VLCNGLRASAAAAAAASAAAAAAVACSDAFASSQVAGVQEEVQLREQDFGNFQDAEGKQREKAERLRYGRFFYRCGARAQVCRRCDGWAVCVMNSTTPALKGGHCIES